MSEVEQTKRKEVLYLIFFLIVGRIRPTVPRAQAVLREAIGPWSITTADVVAYWPANLQVHRHDTDTVIRVDNTTYSMELH